MYHFSRESTTEENPLLRDTPFAKHVLNKDGNHNSPYDQGRIDVGIDNLIVRLVQGINEESFQQVVGRGVMATTGIDQHDLGSNLPWEEMVKGGLQTALETQVVVFEVFGVSRVCTHQLVRTRKATFHQQSQRATFMGLYPNLRMPETIFRKDPARQAWVEAATAGVEAYNEACRSGISYQDARWILPEGTETYIQCEYPLRTFLETYAYRACSMFQWEIMYVFRQMRNVLVAAHPWLEPYVKITCEKTKVCEFQGWERVEGHCTFTWAKEDNRRYKPDPSLRIG